MQDLAERDGCCCEGWGDRGGLLPVDKPRNGTGGAKRSLHAQRAVGALHSSVHPLQVHEGTQHPKKEPNPTLALPVSPLPMGDPSSEPHIGLTLPPRHPKTVGCACAPRGPRVRMGK